MTTATTKTTKAASSLAMVALGCVVAGCGVAPHTRAAGALAPTSVRSVDWNPSHAELGQVHAVADSGDVVAVFAQDRATVFSSRAVVAVDHTVRNWVDGDTIYGADGSARWIVGISGDGRAYYLHGLSSFEDVSERYGLGGQRVASTAVLGPGFVGFRLPGEIALADGLHVTRYATGPLSELVGGGGFGVGVQDSGLTVFDAVHKARTPYALKGARHAAVGPKGRLYAATSRGLFAADPQGQLHLLYDAEIDSVHGLVASGDHVWFADAGELGVVDGDRVLETSGLNLPRDAQLAASASGDVWVMAGTSLQRFSHAGLEPDVGAIFQEKLLPVFARACSSCHLPGGVSGTDLSTAQAWQSERAAIRERVVQQKTMPPEGHALSAADRAAIAAWATE